MKLMITTQVYENYAWREDGTLGVGEDAYWKAKGGNDYVVENFQGSEEEATITVMSLRSEIEREDDAFQEFIVGWSIESNDYLTEFERDQLRWDGRITYPAQKITV